MRRRPETKGILSAEVRGDPRRPSRSSSLGPEKLRTCSRDNRGYEMVFLRSGMSISICILIFSVLRSLRPTQTSIPMPPSISIQDLLNPIQPPIAISVSSLLNPIPPQAAPTVNESVNSSSERTVIHNNYKLNRKTTLSVLYRYPADAVLEYPETGVEGQVVGHLFAMRKDAWLSPSRNFAYSRGEPSGKAKDPVTIPLLVDLNTGDPVPCITRHATCTSI